MQSNFAPATPKTIPCEPGPAWRAACAATLVACALLVGGCASPGSGGGTASSGTAGTVASMATNENVRRFGFLSDYARLQTVAGGGGWLCWRNPNQDWKQFDKVLFERIQVALAPDSTNMVDPTDLKTLVDYFHASLVKAIQREAQVVTATGPGVLQVRIALTDLVPTNQLASLAGTAVPYGFVAEIGAGAASGRPAGSTAYLGKTGLQMQFRDGGTGEVAGECADLQIGRKYAADMDAGVAGAAENWANGYMNSFTQWNYAKSAFDKWSAGFAQRFAELKRG